MSSTFDPYHRWLGIRPEEQPADHYRLLGLARFEDDVEVIRDAAERQMGHVRRYAMGTHANDAHRILNELGHAKGCLSDQGKRAAYDATLKAHRDTSNVAASSGSANAPIPLELATPRHRFETTAGDEEAPLQIAPPPNTPANSTAQTSVPHRPKTLAEMQAQRQRQPRKAPSGRQLIHRVDDLLMRIAGEDNTLLHNFLRAFVAAAAVLVPVVFVVSVLWWVSDQVASSDVSVVTADATQPVAAAPIATLNESPPAANETPPTANFAPTPVVAKPNQPPQFEPINTRAVTMGEELILTFRATDPDVPQNALTYKIDEGPAGGSLDSSTGVYRWTPTSGTGQDVALIVSVTDDGESPLATTQTITIHVRPRTLPAQIENSVGMTLVLIPVGEFLMGSPSTERDRDSDEQQHRVQITKPFYMATTEVTQGQWKAVMRTIPWKGKKYVKEGSDYAATHMSWENAAEFCRRLSAKESRVFRLPTEAEWEYSCRAGSATTYSFGDDASRLSDYAWWGGLVGDGNAKSEHYAHQVGQKRANAFGLFDTQGNVWEWCSDWYGENYYATSLSTDPTGPSTGSDRVNRGGGWYSTSQYCRSANRDWFTSSYRSDNLGFRVSSSVMAEPSQVGQAVPDE